MLTTNELLLQIEKSANVQDSLRSVIFSTIKGSDAIFQLPETETHLYADPCKLVKAKQDELFTILGTLDQTLEGKSPKEVAAFFSSLLDMFNQLYLYRTEGVVTVRIRLIDFIPVGRNMTPPPAFYQEISMIFSPEELRAMQKSLEEIEVNHPLRPFFAGILDQAFDANRYNETSSFVLLSIVEYFIKQLEDNGFKNAEETTEFRNRHERVWKQLEKSVDEMRELESTLNRQMNEYPVLLLIPNLMRSLILIKLGVLSAKFAPSILRTINENTKKYNQAKRMVAFDFSRLPAAQYQLLRRQELILALQSDILQFTGTVLEKKFAVFLKEYERIMLEIQTNSAQLDRNSREFKDLLKKKTMLQGEFEKRRRQLDVITSQKSLVEVQQEMMEQSLKTFDEEGSMHGRITEALKMTTKIEKPAKEQPPEEKKETHRMAAAERRSQE
jgi:hypothetical protein